MIKIAPDKNNQCDFNVKQLAFVCDSLKLMTCVMGIQNWIMKDNCLGVKKLRWSLKSALIGQS